MANFLKFSSVLATGLIPGIIFGLPLASAAQAGLPSDVIMDGVRELKITFIGHGTLYFEYDGRVVHVDPWTKLADYQGLPKADLVLITHEHGDHLDEAAVKAVTKDNTVVATTKTCHDQLGYGEVLANGDSGEFAGFKIEAVPAYNLVHKRDNGQPFHPKGQGNGYVIYFGGLKVYVAGDTENIPEMAKIKDVDAAFLPMNLPYTMTPEMAADAAKSFKPKILYPYHFSETDTSRLVALLKDEPSIEVRIRPMQ